MKHEMFAEHDFRQYRAPRDFNVSALPGQAAQAGENGPARVG